MTRSLIFAVVVAGAAIACSSSSIQPGPYIALDGDTIRVGGDNPDIRLAYIDAPEMPGHCRAGRQCAQGDPFASRAYLQSLLNRGGLHCIEHGRDHYGRVIGDCTVTPAVWSSANDNRNLSQQMLAAGHAQPYVPNRRAQP